MRKSPAEVLIRAEIFPTITRMSRGIITPPARRSDIDVRALVQRIVRELGATVNHEIHLHARAASASADRAQIERVMENLLINASRHTPDDTPIWVRVAPSEAGVEIIVEDAGPGVPADLRRDIFEPFRQGPSLNSHAPGVGISLALVRRFVELHDGSVAARERDGGGSIVPRLTTLRPARGRNRDDPRTERICDLARAPHGSASGTRSTAPQRASAIP